MLELVKFENNHFIWNSILLTLKAYKAIHKRDKSKYKTQATKELAYVAFFMDFRSPYQRYGETDRMLRIIRDEELDPDWRPDNVIKAAMIQYVEDFHTAATVSLLSLYDILNMTNTSIKFVAESLQQTYELVKETQLMNIEEEEYDDEPARGRGYVSHAERLNNISNDLITKTKQILDLSGKLVPAIKNISELKNEIQKEEAKSKTIQGGGDVGEFED